MLTKIKKAALIFGVLFSSSTLAQKVKIDSSQVITLRIDPGDARGTSISDIFDEVEFIPLESKKESVFGKIKQLEIAENRFVIFDEDTKNIFIFDRNGKFIAKINQGKINTIGKQEDQMFYGFQIRKVGSKSLITIQAGKSSVFFDLDGSLVKKEPANKKEWDIVYRFPGSGIVVRSNELIKSNMDSSYYELVLYNSENRFLTAFFPFALNKIINDDLINSGKVFFDYGSSSEVFYTRYFENNIYRIGEKKAELAYRFILPEKYSLPDGFIENSSYKGKRMEYLMKNRDKFYGIFNTYTCGDNLFFNFSSFGFDRKAFIYNLKDNQLMSIGDLEPDALSSFLPVTDLGVLDEYKNRGFHLYQDGLLYNSYSSLAMFALNEQNAEKKIKYNPVLTEYFRTQNKSSNPVIVRLKPKPKR
ncbi:MULTISPECIES: 6-bladed beta-propeller [Pedobacter]|uniref:6-bladed beta-propeller n=1 Tax=Pedobacter TaxID=84567 RepID=UPI00292D3C05|nr:MULTISPECIES: 6-bladed beta-propeller [Pedobacter]